MSLVRPGRGFRKLGMQVIEELAFMKLVLACLWLRKTKPTLNPQL